MTIKEHVLDYLGTLGPGKSVPAKLIWAARFFRGAWPTGPTDWRSVNRVLHQLEAKGLVVSEGKELRAATLWRLK